MHSRVVQQLNILIRQDLETGFHPFLRPPCPAAQRHTKAISELTILRVRLVRARQENAEQVPEHLLDTFKEYLSLFNGNTRSSCIEHYCHEESCCQGHNREVAVSRILQNLMNVCFADLGSDLPSATRWYRTLYLLAWSVKLSPWTWREQVATRRMIMIKNAKTSTQRRAARRSRRLSS